MPEKTFLVNKITNQKFRLNGIKRSNRPPSNNLQANSGMLFGGGNVPPKVDLRADMTPVENQASLATCVANTLAGAYEYLLKKATGNVIDVSRLFIYYNARKKGSELTSEPIEDGGCVMTDAIESLKESGVCLESIWPYELSRVNDQPNAEAYQQAKDHKISDAIALDINLDQMKSCLAQGFPFGFGIQLFSSFDKAAKSGVVPMPDSSETSRESHGSHAMLAVGYSDQSQAFIVRNSWGEEWGDKGYCYIPYQYLSNEEHSFDLWTVKKVMNSDFGQQHWSYDDNNNYLDGNDQHTVDDDSTHVIETVDDGNTDPWAYQYETSADDVSFVDAYGADQGNETSINVNTDVYDNQYQE